MYFQLQAPRRLPVRVTLLTLTHLRPRFLCTVSLTLLRAKRLGVTLPRAETERPSLRAPDHASTTSCHSPAAAEPPWVLGLKRLTCL